MQMVVNGEDEHVIDVKVRTTLLGKKKLELIESDGSSVAYEACRATK